MTDSSYQKFSNNGTNQTPKDIKLVDNGDGTYSIAASIKGTISTTPIDFQGNQSMNSVVGEQITAERTDQLNVMFQYNVQTYDTRREITGTGSITHQDAKAQIHTGTGIGSSYLESKEIVRYFTGHEVNLEGTFIFSAPRENSKQIFGIGEARDTTDGFIGFGYDDGTLSTSFAEFGLWLKTIEDGLIFVNQSDFNGDKLDGTGESGLIINPQAENIIKISYGWYGILPIRVSIFNANTDSWVLVHKYSKGNNTIVPHLPQPSLPFSSYVESTSAGTDIVLQMSSIRGGIVGKPSISSLTNRNFVVKTVKTIIGSNIPLISIRNNPTFQGKKNRVKLTLGTFTPISDGNKSVEFDVYKTGTLTGGAWIARDPDNSTVDYNNTATSFVPTSELVGGTGLAKVDRDRINLIEGDVVISVYPGEEMHVVANSLNSNDVILYFRWSEKF